MRKVVPGFFFSILRIVYQDFIPVNDLFSFEREDKRLSGNTKFQAERSESENKGSGGQQGSTSDKKSRIPDPGGKETSHRFPLNLHGNPFPVMQDEGPFSNFFLDKISKSVREKYPKAHYELEKNANQQVTAVIWYNINDDLRKE